MKKLFVITILFSVSIYKLSAFNIDTSAMLNDMGSTKIDVRIRSLIDYSYYLNQVSNFYSKSDSIANLAILESQVGENDDMFFYSAVNFRQVCLSENVNKAESYLNKALEAAIKNKDEQKQFFIYINLTSLFIENGSLTKAKESIQKALKYILDNKRNRAVYFLTIGDLQLKSNEKISAYENYNNAILLSKEIENDSLQFLAYVSMSNFYQFINDWSKAKEFILLGNQLMIDNSQYSLFDSLMLKAKLIFIHVNNNENELALKLMDDIFPIIEKYRFHHIENYIFGVLRSYYLSNDRQKEICDLYCVKYPKELERLKSADSKIYYRVQALIFENNGQIDSAKYFLQLAEEQTLRSTNPASIANFYKRKGQFYARQHDMQMAMGSFVNYFEYAKQSLHFPFIIDAANLLDSLYFLNGDVANAYKFSKIKENYTDSNATQTQKDKLLNIEIENMSKLKDLEKEKQELVQSRKSNFQVVIIIACIIFSIILLVVFSRYKISKGVLKLFSYVTFVLFFEFIIYLFDNIIHKWAHGEPLKIMAVKVIIISLLLPVHHATDYRVVQYLTKKNLVKDKQVTFRQTVINIWTAFRKWLNVNEEKENKEKETD